MARAHQFGTSSFEYGSLTHEAAAPGRGFNIALGLFLCLLAVYSLFQSPLFEVQEVEVEGARQLTEEQVALVTGIRAGENLFALDLAAARRRLEALPVVERAEVRRAFPGRVVVSIRERMPVAYLSTDAGFWALDGEGVALFVDDGLALSVPIVTATPQPVPAAGERVEAPHLAAALDFIRALSAEGRAVLVEVRLGPEGVVAYTEDRITVRLGSDGDMSERAWIFEGLLQQFASWGRQVAEVDLRHPKSPVFIEKR